MPTVARFEARPGGSPHIGRRVLEHRFDLLGSGPTDLGREIDWSNGLQVRPHVAAPSELAAAGRVRRRLRRQGAVGAVPLPAPALARARPGTWTRLGAQLESWIEANPVELGVNWTTTMDVAIRAANWVAALALSADAADEPWFERTLESLLLHGRFIRSHLEWSEARGNHYLSDVVGLLPVAALFFGEPRRTRLGAVGRGRAGLGDGAPGPPRRRRARGLDLLPPARDRALRLRDAGRGCARARLDPGLVSRAPRPDARLRARLHAARRARAADRGRGRRSVPPARRLRGRSARPSSSVRPGRATAGAGGRERRVPGRWLLRPSKRQPVRDRPLRRRRPPRAWEATATTTSSRSSSADARGPLVVDPGTYVYTPDPVERNRFRSTASTQRCVSAARSRTSFGPTTCSR